MTVTGWRKKLAVAIAIYACSAALIGVALDGFSVTALLSDGFFVGLSLVGAVIVMRAPANPIAWMLVLLGVFEPTAVLCARYAHYALEHGGAPGAGNAAYISSWIWAPSMYLVARLFLRFPTGRPLSRRWGYVETTAAFGASLILIAIPIEFWDRRRPELVLQETNGEGLLAAATTIGFFMIFGAVLLGVPGMIIRFRRARGIERQQLKWFAFSALFVGITAVLDVAILDRLGAPQAVGDVLSAVALNSVAVAVAVSILKYRLYDIDVIINRTLVYTVLTAVLVGAYAGSVLIFRALLDPLTGDNDIAIAASTLGVAALFGPARRRIQQFIDRSFYRSRYDARQTLETFAVRLRDELDLDSLSRELVRVVAETVRPRHASVWLARESAP